MAIPPFETNRTTLSDSGVESPSDLGKESLVPRTEELALRTLDDIQTIEDINTWGMSLCHRALDEDGERLGEGMIRVLRVLRRIGVLKRIEMRKEGVEKFISIFNQIFLGKITMKIDLEGPLEGPFLLSYVSNCTRAFKLLQENPDNKEMKMTRDGFLRDIENHLQRHPDDIDIQKPGKLCVTALHVAAANGDRELVELLLDYGASKELKNRIRQTPADLARCYARNEELARFIESFVSCEHHDKRRKMAKC